MNTEEALEWWTDLDEVGATMHLLVRAGVLNDTESDLRQYRAKPWHWKAERASARKLESIMAALGVVAGDGWEMTCAEMMQAVYSVSRVPVRHSPGGP